MGCLVGNRLSAHDSHFQKLICNLRPNTDVLPINIMSGYVTRNESLLQIHARAAERKPKSKCVLTA